MGIQSMKFKMRHIFSIFLFFCVVGVAFGGIFTRSKCVPVPNNVCAVVYDDEKCNGWKLNIAEGEIMFKMWDPVYYWYRNDIESVSVRSGCTFTGFDDSSLNEATLPSDLETVTGMSHC